MLETQLRRAVLNDCADFRLYYQPVVDAKTGAWIGAECLIRWVDEKLGFIMPGQFIPVAESLGLIIPIGDWVLQTSISKTQDIVNRYDNFNISINLSMLQFRSDFFVSSIKTIVQEFEFNPQNLMLEITESMAACNEQGILDKLSQLKKLGMRIGIDDFGTDTPSFKSLSSLPLDVIKINRSFIGGIYEDTLHKDFIRNISEMARPNDLRICVGGVETEDQLEFARTSGADMIQGYYLAKPMPFDEFESQLEINRGKIQPMRTL